MSFPSLFTNVTQSLDDYISTTSKKELNERFAGGKSNSEKK
jgi:hypothetical protein